MDHKDCGNCGILRGATGCCCPCHWSDPAETDLALKLELPAFTDQAITAEYFKRLRIHKARLVEAGISKNKGWPKGKKRKVDGGGQ